MDVDLFHSRNIVIGGLESFYCGRIVGRRSRLAYRFLPVAIFGKVSFCEIFPREEIREKTIGTDNVMRAALACKVKNITDKAALFHQGHGLVQGFDGEVDNFSIGTAAPY